MNWILRITVAAVVAVAAVLPAAAVDPGSFAVLALEPVDGTAVVQKAVGEPRLVAEGEALPGAAGLRLLEVLADRLVVGLDPAAATPSEEVAGPGAAGQPPAVRRWWLFRGRLGAPGRVVALAERPPAAPPRLLARPELPPAALDRPGVRWIVPPAAGAAATAAGAESADDEPPAGEGAG